MICTLGSTLQHQYEIAEQARNVLRDQRITVPGEKKADKEMLAAKQRYLESFADWLGHKAFCHNCKPKA